MSYLIAVVGDRLQAEQAYTDLEDAGLRPEQRAIVGTGYRSTNDFPFLDPQGQAKQRALFMAFWLVPFGFFAGFSFNLITGLHTLDWAGTPGNHIVGGLLGMIGGAMGSVMIGGGLNLNFSGGSASPYVAPLKAGKYLVIVQGPEALRTKASHILRSLNPESLQTYSDPNTNY